SGAISPLEHSHSGVPQISHELCLLLHMGLLHTVLGYRSRHSPILLLTVARRCFFPINRMSKRLH
ncbi:MAG: hypothetical protein AB8U48_03080, partial [Anaplasma ovis]